MIDINGDNRTDLKSSQILTHSNHLTTIFWHINHVTTAGRNATVL
jgi:hypothetical protein